MRLSALPLLCALLSVPLVAAVPDGTELINAENWQPNPVPNRPQQLDRDKRMFYATMFPNTARVGALVKAMAKSPNPPSISESMNTGKILGRILVAMAWAKLQYTLTANDKAHLLDWPWPVSTALGHGQRVVFEVQGLGKGDDIYSLFIYGKVQDIPDPDPYQRSGASHGLVFSTDKTAVMTEVKLGGFTGTVRNIIKGLKDQHHGVDLAFGGLGNTGYGGKLIGPEGCQVDPATGAIVRDTQHGHLFMHTDDRPAASGRDPDAGLLVGIEPSAYGKTDMFGASHTLLSAFTDSTEEIGVTGGQKMQLFLSDLYDPAIHPPAKYGGMWVALDKPQFDALVKVIAQVDVMAAGTKKQFFWDLLNATNSPAAQAVVVAATGVAFPAPVRR